MPPTPAIADCSDSTAERAAGRLIALLHAVDGCSQSLRRAIDILASEHELNATQLTVLWACGMSPDGIGQSHLAARIGVSPAQASAVVEQLRRRNYLEARRASGDRRRQQWSLTASGHEVVRTTADGLAAIERRANTSGEQQTHELCERLTNLAAAIERTNSLIAGEAYPRLYGFAVQTDERDAGPGHDGRTVEPTQQEVRR